MWADEDKYIANYYFPSKTHILVNLHVFWGAMGINSTELPINIHPIS